MSVEQVFVQADRLGRIPLPTNSSLNFLPYGRFSSRR